MSGEIVEATWLRRRVSIIRTTKERTAAAKAARGMLWVS
jgi:hypothetical protein